MSLTLRRIRQAPTRDKGYALWDDSPRGLGLRVNPGGRKTFFFQYKIAGRTERVTLGAWGDLTLDEARRVARDLVVARAAGQNPAAERRRRRSAPTMAELGEGFLAARQPELKPSSVASYRRSLRQLSAFFGRRPVEDLGTEDLRRLRAAMEDRPIAFNRCLATLSAAWSWAEGAGWPLPRCPARRFPRNPERPRDRYLTPAELGRLGTAIEEFSPAFPVSCAAVALLALSGARRSEVVGLRWQDVDFSGRRLVLPDSKTGAKVIYLPAPALALLTQQKGRHPEYVFPSDRREGPITVTSVFNCWRRLTKAAEIEGATPHDLRRTVATYAVSRGIGTKLVAGLLGDKTTALVDRVYARVRIDPLLEAAAAVGGELAAHLGLRFGTTGQAGRTRRSTGYRRGAPRQAVARRTQALCEAGRPRRR
jgi:integrase